MFYLDLLNSRKIIQAGNDGKSGIYMWINNINGKTYIGHLGNSIRGQVTRYFWPSYVSSPARGNSLIFKAITKYGLKCFSLVILEYCPVELLQAREQYWIGLLNP